MKEVAETAGRYLFLSEKLRNDNPSKSGLSFLISPERTLDTLDLIQLDLDPSHTTAEEQRRRFLESLRFLFVLSLLKTDTILSLISKFSTQVYSKMGQGWIENIYTFRDYMKAFEKLIRDCREQMRF